MKKLSRFWHDKTTRLSGKELCRILKSIGYHVDHQTGSHIIIRNEDPPYRRLTVPNHKEIAKGTLRSIIRQAGLTLEEFIEINIKS